jgi:GH25 family lysozyme M1 (1,4-beta-N-acetylmuramidase)
MARAFGVDISKYQSSQDGSKKQDFDALKAHSEEVVFIAARAGISWNYEDPMFDYYWSEMARIKVSRLAYHVVYFGESALAQMDSLFKILDNQVNWEHDRLVLDLEVAGINTRARITATTQKCLDICRSRTGRYPICYSRASWVNSYLTISQLPKLDWWLASYLKTLPYPLFTPEHPGPPTLPIGVDTYLIHQTGDKTKGIGSISRYLDYDRWNGNKADVLRYFNNPNHGDPPIENPVEVLFRARCVVSALYTRKGPGLDYKAVGSLSFGEEVDVFEVKNEWFRIDPTASIWCSGKPRYMRQLDPNQNQDPLFKAKVIVSALYKRKGPGKTYDICGYLVKGEVINVYEIKDGWYRIDPGDQIWSCGMPQYMQTV